MYGRARGKALLGNRESREGVGVLVVKTSACIYLFRSMIIPV